MVRKLPQLRCCFHKSSAFDIFNILVDRIRRIIQTRPYCSNGMTEHIGVLRKEQCEKSVGMNRANAVCTEFVRRKISQILCNYQVTSTVYRRSKNMAIHWIGQI